jgi:hypothetical protein
MNSNLSNPIIDFLEQGNDLKSPEGIALLKDCEITILTEAIDCCENRRIIGILSEIIDKPNSDVFLRRKIMLALSG